jgi:hypothetical protein
MTSNTFNMWHLQSTTHAVVRPMCAKQAVCTTKGYFRGLNIDGDDGP